MKHTVDVLKFWALPNSVDPDQTAYEEWVWSVLPHLLSEKDIMNASLDNQHFIWEEKEKSV